jgi:MFS family permease
MKNNNNIKLYSYRWVVLIVFFALNLIMQIHYLTFASITGEAAKYYGVSDLKINFLAASYMLVYVLMSLPVAYILNRLGLYKGVGLGAVLLGIFGLLKGFYAGNYTIVLWSSIALAVAQPLIGNGVTRFSTVWFPVAHRGVITGIVMLSQFVGMLLALAITPYIVEKYEIKGMLMIYGVITFIICIIFLMFMREKPPTPPDIEEGIVRTDTWEGIKLYFRSPGGLIILVTFFFGLGIFNSVTTCLEQILRSRNYDYNTVGMLGGLMLFAGIVGACFWPVLSDKLARRKSIIMAGSLLIIPCLLAIDLSMHHTVIVLACLGFGFALLGVGPVLFQYAAEISVPAPETVSQSILQLSGQFAGLLFVLGMNAFGDYTKGTLVVFAAMVLVAFLLQTRMKESPVFANKIN